MKTSLENMGFNNVYFKPKFRETNAISPDKLYIPDGEPYRVCTFSRIRYSKGIEDAIEAVRYVNNTLGRTVYNLDIYGLPDDDYVERFDELKNSFEPFINYRGYVQGTAASSKELHTCFAMLFPTWYEGEGFAGTVVDAFCAGVSIGLTYGKDMPGAIEIGSTLAASVITSSENVCPRFMPEELGLEKKYICHLEGHHE
jgi:glycosyltransferase involved in cell wall biosynthesis